MDTTSPRKLRKKLLHFGRAKLVRTAQSQNISTLQGSKSDLINRIIKSISKQKEEKRKKEKKRKQRNRSQLQMTNPIYSDKKISKTQNKTRRKSNDKDLMKENVLENKRRKKMKPKRKSKSCEKHGEKQENIKRYLYEIVDMSERPYLNGKHCKIVRMVNESEYRVSLINNGSQHVVSKINLKQITEKHKHSKPIHILVEEKNIVNNNQFISNYDGNVLAIAVFVEYQMIFKVIIDKSIQHLFGTEFKSFKSECLWFLEQIYYGTGSKQSHFKIMGRFLLTHFECNDKDIIFLMDYRDEHIIRDIPLMSLMDMSIISMCNSFEIVPSDFDLLQQIWRNHDVHGFGEINKKEFGKFLSSLTVNTRIHKRSSSVLFDKIDEEQITAITFNQFVKYMLEHKEVLYKLLLELASDYELETSLSLSVCQGVLSKIHKLVLLLYEMYECMLATDPFSSAFGVWEEKLFDYVQFVLNHQMKIDEKVKDYKEHNQSRKNFKNLRYLQKCSEFTRIHMPNLD